MVYVNSLFDYCGTERFPVRIDIDKDIVKFNRKELDNKSRKNVANDLRTEFMQETYMFKQPILLTKGQKLVVTTLSNKDKIDKPNLIKLKDIEIRIPTFKERYINLRLYTKLEGMKTILREGYRYLSHEEIQHIINLIHKDKNESLIFSVFCDLFEQKK